MESLQRAWRGVVALQLPSHGTRISWGDRSRCDEGAFLHPDGDGKPKIEEIPPHSPKTREAHESWSNL
jgi:hypothetical protein